MARTLLTTQTPANTGGLTDATDAQTYTLGNAFYVTQAEVCTGMRWFASLTAPTGTVAARLYLYSTGAELAAANFAPINVGAWNTVLWNPGGAGISLTANTAYMVAIFTNNRYTATVNFFVGANLVNGVIVGAQDDTDPLGTGTIRNGRLNTAGAPTFPNAGGGSLFWADPLIADVVTGVGGGSLGALGGSGVGTRTVFGSGGGSLGALGGSGAGTVISGAAPAATTGGWYGLLDIFAEARELAAEVQAPSACPNDGEPLLSGPDGGLYCPFDGWRPR